MYNIQVATNIAASMSRFAGACQCSVPATPAKHRPGPGVTGSLRLQAQDNCHWQHWHGAAAAPGLAGGWAAALNLRVRVRPSLPGCGEPWPCPTGRRRGGRTSSTSDPLQQPAGRRGPAAAARPGPDFPRFLTGSAPETQACDPHGPPSGTGPGGSNPSKYSVTPGPGGNLSVI